MIDSDCAIVCNSIPLFLIILFYRYEVNPFQRRDVVQKKDPVRKFVYAAHLSSPVVAVKLLLPKGLPVGDELPVVDVLTTSYDDKIVRYEDIVNNLLMKPTSFGDLSAILCINCIWCDCFHPTQLVFGDLSNCVHVYKQSDEDPRRYDKEGIIRVNDSVFYINAVPSGELIITTRQGIYIFARSSPRNHSPLPAFSVSSNKQSTTS